MAGKVALIMERERCKGCGLCIVFCNRGLLSASEDLNSLGYHPVEMTGIERCNGCGSCALVCPDLVIHVQKEETA